MAALKLLTERDRAWLTSYTAEVVATFEDQFRSAGGRFPNWTPLLERFTSAADCVLTHGWEYFGSIEEAHNELHIASSLLKVPGIRQLEYEPRLDNCLKSIDFRTTVEDGTVDYIDVKTIKPAAVDRWDQYERARREQWFPENTDLILAEDFRGGEIFHSWFATRGRMLEHTLAFEAKIVEAKLAAKHTRFAMAFCGEGYHWSVDELADFVEFYFEGRHRSDDPFSKAELKFMAEKHLRLNRTITRFACLSRPQNSIRERRIKCFSPHESRGYADRH